MVNASGNATDERRMALYVPYMAEDVSISQGQHKFMREFLMEGKPHQFSTMDWIVSGYPDMKEPDTQDYLKQLRHRHPRQFNLADISLLEQYGNDEVLDNLRPITLSMFDINMNQGLFISKFIDKVPLHIKPEPEQVTTYYPELHDRWNRLVDSIANEAGYIPQSHIVQLRTHHPDAYEEWRPFFAMNAGHLTSDGLFIADEEVKGLSPKDERTLEPAARICSPHEVLNRLCIAPVMREEVQAHQMGLFYSRHELAHVEVKFADEIDDMMWRDQRLGIEGDIIRRPKFSYSQIDVVKDISR